jgi:hypothetical protein
VISERTAETVKKFKRHTESLRDHGSAEDVSAWVIMSQWIYWVNTTPGYPDGYKDRREAGLRLFLTIEELIEGFSSMLTDTKAGAI